MRKVSFNKWMLIIGGALLYVRFYFSQDDKFYLSASMFFVGYLVYDGIINYFKQFEE